MGGKIDGVNPNICGKLLTHDGSESSQHLLGYKLPLKKSFYHMHCLCEEHRVIYHEAVENALFNKSQPASLDMDAVDSAKKGGNLVDEVPGGKTVTKAPAKRAGKGKGGKVAKVRKGRKTATKKKTLPSRRLVPFKKRDVCQQPPTRTDAEDDSSNSETASYLSETPPKIVDKIVVPVCGRHNRPIGTICTYVGNA